MFDGVSIASELLLADPAQLVVWTARVRPHLEKMATSSNGRFLASDILTAVAAGRMQMWLVVRGPDLLCVTITEIHQYPRRRAMRLIGLVGHRVKTWLHLLDAMEVSARENFGCDLMEALHMPRMAPMLNGYRMTHWLAEKAL